jgi:hypothetical protein
MSLRCDKTVKIMVYLKFFCLLMKGLDPDPDPGGPKTYGSSGSGTQVAVFYPDQ